VILWRGKLLGLKPNNARGLDAPADRVHCQLGGGGIRPISRAGGIHYQDRTTVEDFSGGHDHFEGGGQGKGR